MCKYFVKGNCKYGNRCALLHSTTNSGGGSHPPSSSSSSLKQNGRGRLRRNTFSDDDGIEAVNSDTESNSDEIQTCKSSSDGMVTGGEEESTSSTYTSGGGTSSMGLLAASLLSSGGNSKNSRRHGAAATEKATRSGGSNRTKSSSGSKNAIPIPPKVHVNSWATGSGANLFHKEASSSANQKTSMASSYHKNSQSQHDANGSNPVSPFRTTFDNEPQRKSQPIPGARSNKNNGGRPGLGIHREEEEDDEDDDAGFSTTQASQRIDRLALSNSGVKQSSFAGSPFLGSSIPLLDHFKELSNGGGNDSGGYNSSDNTPMTAHSLTRSPQLGSASGNLLTRHAFTAVDNPAAASASGGNARGLGGGSSRVMGLPPNTKSMHLDLSSPMMYPIGGGSPRSYHDFGSHSMFSPGASNEPISPRNTMTTTRLRSNSHLSSPQNIGFPPATSLDIRSNSNSNHGYSGSLHDSPFLASDNQLRGKGFSLMDVHSLSPFGQPAVSSLSASMDNNNWLRGSMPQPVGSSHGHGMMGQSPRMSRHLSGEDTHDYHQQLSMPTSSLGPVGQQRPSYKNHIGDLGYEAGMFELEDQDSNGLSTVGQQQKQNIAPTPSFISVEGFAQKFSGMSMKK